MSSSRIDALPALGWLATHPRPCTVPFARHNPYWFGNNGRVASSREISFCIVLLVTAVVLCKNGREWWMRKVLIVQLTECFSTDWQLEFLSSAGWFSLKSRLQNLSKWNNVWSTHCWSLSKLKFASSVPSKRYQQLAIWLITNVSIVACFCKSDWGKNTPGLYDFLEAD
jgi:hypothetical protein